MKTPLTKERLKHHLAYNSWKYLLLVVLCVLGWNLIYTTTAYRPPAEKIVDVYLCSGYGDQEALDAYLENIRQTEMSDMEQMQSIFLSVTNDDYYGAIQLATYVMAGEGDIYLLDKDNFVNYAGQGALIDLEPYIDEGRAGHQGAGCQCGVAHQLGDRRKASVRHSCPGLYRHGAVWAGRPGGYVLVHPGNRRKRCQRGEADGHSGTRLRAG